MGGVKEQPVDDIDLLLVLLSEHRLTVTLSIYSDTNTNISYLFFLRKFFFLIPNISLYTS